ncbi:MAG TPA: HPF/RaiA family ribosome-associated protein [Xanthobacteraceae bacterium]|nr:HPF/RaiA family ribosome-associated protein [Xanthobacteraceae bacterium]
MQTPPRIEFENINPTQEIKDAIEKQVAELEQRSDRITACRVVLKAPSHHHREGGLYEVHIHLELPDGREVNVERTAPADERRADLAFAVNDAFKRARRQLRDRVRRMQRQAKQKKAR